MKNLPHILLGLLLTIGLTACVHIGEEDHDDHGHAPGEHVEESHDDDDDHEDDDHAEDDHEEEQIRELTEEKVEEVSQEEAPVAVREVFFNVVGGNYYYDATEIRVQEGDKVTINFKSEDGYHDIVIDEFDAHSDHVSTGEETTFSFVADKKGTFEYYCSVGSHRSKGQVGTLIVE